MPKSRKIFVSPDASPYYHCVSHCLRRACLCGGDILTGQNFEHRRLWIDNTLPSILIREYTTREPCKEW